MGETGGKDARMTYIPEKLRIFVFERAGGRCEYCLIHSRDAYSTHELDYIRAEKHKGQTIETNLSLSRYDCNKHKGTDLAYIDPLTDEIANLFNPRQDQWSDHFELDGATIMGRTPKGRATVSLLDMNASERVL